jgi:hypothetical protein
LADSAAGLAAASEGLGPDSFVGIMLNRFLQYYQILAQILALSSERPSGPMLAWVALLASQQTLAAAFSKFFSCHFAIS